MTRDPLDNAGFCQGHFSFRKVRAVECPCSAQFTTGSRTQKFCQRCLLKKALREKYGAELRTEAAA